ncbi:hypothetical protein BGZ65_009028 [Modicella reniformis]|uniref:BTB domain-containing protein n=1 Tax=Modicella reniformis TaxID=1440133 RepID=A0A9P6JG81_9FUNG|nr:hypothetical protein BGZ65_009028 [Modicella reniformis]
MNIATNNLIDLAISCTRLSPNTDDRVSINTTLNINTGCSTVCTVTRQSSHEVCIGLQSNSDTASFKYMHCIPCNLTCKADVKVVGINQYSNAYSGNGGNYDHFRTGKKFGKKRGSLQIQYDSRLQCITNTGFQIVVLEESIVDTIDPSKYAFHLVLSTPEKLPLLTDLEIKPSVTNKSFKEIFPEKYQDTLKFLKDPKSVNTGFLFTIHSCQRKIALWTHSRLLDKYPHFQELFEKVYSRLVLIPIKDISLATFCVLLKYLYTEDLDLVVDPTQYLLCDMNHLQNKTSMDSASSLAIADLRKQCLENLLASVNNDNAIEILFRLGKRFKEEVGDSVIKYISEHSNDILALQN